ncbi:lactate permease [Clostridium saccharoperbutylacetonicum]|uniref:L-lactate permease n=2 Tax=Clostridium saccharoperbutylacetonicum TaxID=36745 RepID=M1MGT8_9CLOT|nr:L-lactate permease [Clostridium saccharoperbutylacetonicum]AGF54166.1 L-lactate permease LctP [Clostridium saccharoperbutylacetonicum N1-4(HMT)]NRT59320.1 lactate permease [Clostridium saccharoperbutylacetonicum]NSB28511.1 lactate permease [Clostridium saccharoperbutylacetonicum]NSB42002.1 lactate permease [Clostridium saccharoperbutylacetonicum]
MYLSFFLACIPIVWLMVSLGKLKIPGYKACPIGYLITVLIAVIILKMNITNAITATLEGVATALWPIVLVIIGAVFTYNLSIYTGSMEIIKKIMTSVTSDKRILVLILAWGFGGFLEAVAGFGTAVAIPASILAALGFEPVFAAIICLVANTTPTAFGAIGLPVSTLAQVTGLDVGQLSYITTVQLTIMIILIPFILVSLTGNGIKAIKGVFGITLASGIAFAVPQILVAKFIGAELPAVIGSIVSIAVTIFMAKKFYNDKNDEKEIDVTFKEGFMAWLPFVLVFLFVMICSPLFKAIYTPLSQIKTSILIYTGQGAKPDTFSWIVTPGVLIIIATYLGGLLQGYKLKEISVVLVKTFKQMTKSAVTIVSIVSLAKIMGYSGMINSIAQVLVLVAGGFYPAVAPVIGALGTFITGSDTSANILFGQLQVQVANAIGANPYWIAAGNVLGTTAGKMISPQSIAVATAATGLIGNEGKILNSALKVCVVYIVISGIIVFFGGSILGF